MGEDRNEASDRAAALWATIAATRRPATLTEYLKQSAEAFGDRVLLDCFDSGRRLTYAELRLHTTVAAGVLAGRGVRMGDRVAVCLPNSPEVAVAFFALARLGAVMVSINTRLEVSDFDYVVTDSECSMIVSDPASLSRIGGARSIEDLPVVTVCANHDDGPGQTGWDLLVDGASVVSEPAPVDDSAPVTILYTSGSTGMPKGCVHSHRYWLVLAQVSGGLERGSQILADAPFFYMVGPASLVQAMWVGGTVHLPERPSHRRFMQWVRERAIDSAWVSVHQLADEPRADDRDHHLRIAYTDDIPGDRIDEFERRFAIKARNCYGMTEIGLGTIVPPDDDDMARAGSIGIPAPLRECILIASDLTEITEPGRVGELCVRGVGLFDGYYGRDRAETGWLDDGWFRTGDLARFDERGWFYFVGRSKDLIRRNGENISAREVEQALEAIDGIVAAAVVPIADPRRGEEVRACIVLSGDSGVDDLPPSAILSALDGRLAAYKRPRFIDYFDELPRTASDKIAKMALRDGTFPIAPFASFDAEAGSFR